MPRKEQGWITFQASAQERKILDELSEKLQRTKTEILRELVRGLNLYSLYLPQSTLSKKQLTKDTDIYAIDITNTNVQKTLKVSSCNIIKGIVTQVIRTEISSQVTVKLIHEAELTSMITTASADQLELQEGTEAYVVINPNNIVIAKEETQKC